MLESRVSVLVTYISGVIHSLIAHHRMLLASAGYSTRVTVNRAELLRTPTENMAKAA
jgi:hypothetical protein